MKRSKALALSLMGVSAVLLQACDDPEVEAELYSDVQNCLDTGSLTREQCVELHDAALANHMQTAPRFESREDCYAAFGKEQCEQQQTASNGGSGIWMPLMMGFMASRMLDGMSGRQSAPLYRTGNDPNTLRTGRGHPVGTGFGTKAKLPEWAAKPARTRTQSISRGGFGSRSYGFGG